MNMGLVAGVPIVLVTPASPEDAATVTPALTAASSARLTRSRLALSGNGLPPNDSLSTLTWSWVTAQSIPTSSTELKTTLDDPNTLMPTMLAPGAAPSTLIRQGRFSPGKNGFLPKN